MHGKLPALRKKSGGRQMIQAIRSDIVSASVLVAEIRSLLRVIERERAGSRRPPACW
jgi:hypothetical protein